MMPPFDVETPDDGPPEMRWLEGSSLGGSSPAPDFPSLPGELDVPRTGDELAFTIHESRALGKFRRWLIDAPPGAQTIYHTGLLGWDRSPFGGADSQADALASYVARASRLRLVLLFAVRIAPTIIDRATGGVTAWGVFDYRAVRTLRPWPGDEAMEDR